MPLTQEQIESQRVKFESSQNTNYLSFNKHCDLYTNTETAQAFRIWLSAIESVEIELPNFQLMDDPDGQGRGEYVMREVLESHLEKQGYKVKP